MLSLQWATIRTSPVRAWRSWNPQQFIYLLINITPSFFGGLNLASVFSFQVDRKKKTNHYHTTTLLWSFSKAPNSTHKPALFRRHSFWRPSLLSWFTVVLSFPLNFCWTTSFSQCSYSRPANGDAPAVFYIFRSSKPLKPSFCQDLFPLHHRHHKPSQSSSSFTTCSKSSR